MSLSFRIDDIKYFESEFVEGCHVDLPEVGQHEGLLCRIAGWVVSKVPIDSLIIKTPANTERRTKIYLDRPDVQAHFGGSPHALRSGFWDGIPLFGLPRSGALEIQAALQGKTSSPVRIADIYYTRSADHLVTQDANLLQPLLVNALQRSGTTWLSHLLGEHPQLVVYPEYPYEMRIAAYFQHALRVLAGPGNLFYSSHPDYLWFEHNFVGNPPIFLHSAPNSVQISTWLKERYWQQVASFALNATESFYRHTALALGKRAPKYFVEKLPVPGYFWGFTELYSQPKEIVLVRDFRDVFCSILAFNQKRGFASFGRELSDSDLLFVPVFSGQVINLVDQWKARSASSLLVRYEDLLSNPAAELRRIFDYLEVDSAPSTIAQLLQAGNRETTETTAHRTSRTPEDSIGRWRHDLSSDVAEALHQVLEPSLRAFGYA